jgi:hypothetical protein
MWYPQAEFLGKKEERGQIDRKECPLDAPLKYKE